MNKLPSVKALLALIAIALVLISSMSKMEEKNKIINNSETIIMNDFAYAHDINNKGLLYKEIASLKNEAIIETKLEEEIPEIVYDGMTFEELVTKLNKNLKSTLTGYGYLFAKYAIEYEVDPYLSLAIVLHETGCDSGKCSSLARKCNNIGGMKGSNGCGAYKRFKTLDEGIEAFYKNLANNYYKKGLTTPTSIGKKYAESASWPERIKFYIKKIKES